MTVAPSEQASSVTVPSANAPLEQWLAYLLSIHPTEIDMGLTRVSKVAQRLNVLDLGPSKVVTVGGTNGKGTTCAMLENILRLSGLTVGVYSSPHMLKYNERVRINGQDQSDEAFVAAFEQIEAARGNISLTFFEYATLAGLILFKAAKLDVVILEVGLGGRLDATNMIDADISAVTSVDLDHEAYLGNTRELVGREKAGIFRQGKPAIVGEPNLPHTVNDVAQQLGAKLYRVGTEFTYQQNGHTWDYQGQVLKLKQLSLPTLPNAATVIAIVEHGWPEIAADIIAKGISSARLTGRLEQVSEQPLILLDVAHNPHAARFLVKQLTPIVAGKRVFALCGMLKDKDIGGVLPVVSPLIDTWYLVSLQGERGAHASLLRQTLTQETKACEFEDIATAWTALKAQIQPDDVVIVFGSFYTVAGFKSLFKQDNRFV
ncbi:bifunctional tetrahydrofolate synthase/dihydrofolate synthase [Shewanella oneidensis MR-1]|uniref:Dihydrofolate synthase/folylpolyglutamate synthase n=1 Tax=Shewanella oneidensis (strain ATCC 700550 / JCM 31522 / CIP 106686 / LMG 19005 / NCIMB 14063 / MR-1) TaxID=211586 RepID=Q8ECR5_SHEON|nr:bifunctional tetrahydrofolate synthase/dihydrofolate synthase [Shewanella oneidensis]AAN56076.1 bifunctional folylpolyglutamate synthase/dihydrofolate synthase FolC [Shewanella oneidensis MR-1]MDX5999491.1 bifunctional tetrahydrofolate synthase/dihydrofolate synthase [Shewanella oneidensis]MEE2028163.1 Dihydrofolate synthase/folylpolyglutamate synthase [Shewanella oneidensis]QKG97512.1 bifunctional tetrahydrofolate synthase/dihydrofolate synthase [Shewanella oneidensis MR-1]